MALTIDREQFYLNKWLEAKGWIIAPENGVVTITPEGMEQLRYMAESQIKFKDQIHAGTALDKPGTCSICGIYCKAMQYEAAQKRNM